MAYNEALEDRINEYLKRNKVTFSVKKMFGGLCYMLDDKMCFGLVKNQMMCRVGVDAYKECLARDGSSEMNFTGRAMKGYVFVDDEATDMEEDLEFWIEKCLAHNPFAKASKKRKKS